MVLLLPSYRQNIRKDQTKKLTVRKWSTEAIEKLQACLECTNWDIFKDTAKDLDELTETVSDYIAFCEETCIDKKQVTIYPNNKPWFTSKIKQLLRKKHQAFKAGDMNQYKALKYSVNKAIRDAKIDYKEKLEDQFCLNNTRGVWQSLQTITQYKQKPNTSDIDPSLPDRLNSFYSRFDEKNHSHPDRSVPLEVLSSASALTVTEAQVRCELSRLNTRKAAGPDQVSPATLRHCADQLTPIYTYIFQQSLDLCKVPTIFKTSTIVPVPKKGKSTSLNDYRPVALTPIAMKVLERIVLKHIKDATDDLMDPDQFAYRSNRSVDDATALSLHFVLQHLEAPGRYARILFIDFSSAFNTIIPQKLFNKLQQLNISPQVCHWVLSFLLDRPQKVRMGDLHSQTKILSTGAPQGCVLSPLLFTLFTNDCRSHSSSNKIIKFSDDTTLIGIISDNDESAYRQEVQLLTEWCEANDLELNVVKTKEMHVDFRRHKSVKQPLSIGEQEVETVDSFKFLGTTIHHTLSWEDHIQATINKSQQRLYFLRQLKKFKVGKKIMVLFYRATIETILTFSVTVWFGRATVAQKNKLQNIAKTASRIIGCEQPPIHDLYEKRLSNKASSIIADPSHPGHNMFSLLPSGRRLRHVAARTARFRDSFYPAAVRAVSTNTAVLSVLHTKQQCEDSACKTSSVPPE